ncbi:hypothetical protein [uncultured Shimia sp.]|uniref:hypothetical protein n=1 Tax=uncultured Shimia sp. TaxID=573152 RepID=UPI0025D92268|nr:hypothetical protein [uncultured Shimia sp.]
MSHRDLEIDDVFAATGGPSQPSPLTEEMTVYLATLLNNNNSSTNTAKGFLNQPNGSHLGVPAGYSYLFQLAGHDLVFSSLVPRAYDDIGGRSQNLRQEKLALETLFGGGPVVCPHAFDMKPQDGTHRLRLGKFRPAGRMSDDRLSPSADLPRNRYSADGPDADGPFTDVLIPDSRNDDNNILAQLTAFFHAVYNMLVAQAATTPMPGTGDPIPPHHRARVARLATARLYRRILRHDLLPRIMAADILALFDATPDLQPLGRTPSQTNDLFAYGIARMAHSMVRPEYMLNNGVGDHILGEVDLRKIINHSSLHEPGMVPTPIDWKIDWDLFFTATGAQLPDNFNWAIRFGPHAADGMTIATAGKPTKDHYPAGTAMRDLLREKWVGLGRVQDLIQSAADALTAQGLTAPFDAATHYDRIATTGMAALEAAVRPGHKPPMSDADKATITANLPLVTFLALEAQIDGNNGATYGPLGGLILGAAFAPVFEDDTPSDTDAQIAQALETAAYGSTPIRDMPTLVATTPIT